MKKQLLIVDDDLYLRNSISSYLVSAGFLVDTVSNVEAALRVIRLHKPDLIIADIMMPCLDGYDLLAILRADQLLSNIPIIFLTAKGMTHDRIVGYDLGCNAYLTKPFNPQELLAIINNIFVNIDLLLSKRSLKPSLPITESQSTALLNFTPKESEVLFLVAQGLMNKEIALRLNLSQRNIEKYVSRLLKKTNTRNRTELAQFALSKNMNQI
uniref:Putative transcriptional regulator Ycf29 n=1 Tax=Grateloupia turuturu TaxID=118375 RepID=A0A6B9P5I4_9FLOR|nr:putative transcriptional regulator Ycf29 [Grateloupia turuturu]QHD45253.1 putative transcriptional regulator Ycf29 [Grateloupia turuturu]UXC96797.1 putative transcriptional regulator Ycf29 [Grateloupia turuturu]